MLLSILKLSFLFYRAFSMTMLQNRCSNKSFPTCISQPKISDTFESWCRQMAVWRSYLRVRIRFCSPAEGTLCSLSQNHPHLNVILTIRHNSQWPVLLRRFLLVAIKPWAEATGVVLHIKMFLLQHQLIINPITSGLLHFKDFSINPLLRILLPLPSSHRGQAHVCRRTYHRQHKLRHRLHLHHHRRRHHHPCKEEGKSCHRIEAENKSLFPLWSLVHCYYT